jgi:CubicO group peptidase (beta-lactamase class C family)
MVIEKVSGEPYAQYLAKHVFAPAGLTATSYCDETKPDPHRAAGYAKDANGKPVNSDPIDLSVPFSAGALCSTVLDLVRWTTALSGGRVVSPAGYRAMTTSHGIAGEQPYGFGLEVGDVKGHRAVFHNGGITGFVSELHDYPDDGVTIAVLTNTESAASKQVEHAIAIAELGVPSEVVAISASELAAYAGTYIVPMLGDVVIAVDGDHLTIHPDKQPTFPLEYHGKDVFALDAVEAVVTFERDPDTKAVTGLLIKQGTHDVEGKRKE